MNISSVIITFNPNINVINLINALNFQNVTPIIVDNGSKNFDFSSVDDIQSHLIRLKDNLGIATAQNRGIERAIELGADYIIFFDQDSTIPDNFVQDMIDDYQFISKQNIKIGALGPRFIDERYNFYYKTISISKHGLKTKHDVSEIKVPFNSTLLISSGSFICVETLKQVGLMRDEYFIDYVDTEWCLRAESLGFKNYISAKAVMKHTIGDNVLNFKFMNVPVHSAFRRYFRVRNAFYMLREPHVPLILFIRELVGNTVHQFILILFEKNSWSYIKSYFKGLKDGIFCKGNSND
ncbi:glycosyltransferase family 2 protein [Acinetobacter lwoffii]|uniref:glycosyltransferase family 2 protein n=1 Tax=Acinetobacter lwoffii TaxID=28090 RepID=UPI0022065533|nr:dTDP-rhamnosyl transferase RfbF [Acinetobacter lwoffii]